VNKASEVSSVNCLGYYVLFKTLNGFHLLVYHSVELTLSENSTWLGEVNALWTFLVLRPIFFLKRLF